MSISRRKFLQLSLGTACGGMLSTACSTDSQRAAKGSKQLNIYSWPDYIQPGAIDEFERRYGIEVVYDTVSSNEGLLAKLQAGAADYDIIVPSNYYVTKMRQLNLLAELDKDKLSNFKYLMPRFQSSKFDPDCKYSIPYTFGTTGIAYNTQAPCYAGRHFPDDWDSFWDERIAGRMTLLEDARETIGAALIHRGQSVNTLVEKEIKLACDDLKQQKKYVMCYTSDQAITALASADSWLSLIYSGDAQQAARVNKDVKYVIPKTGASMWVDNLCIPKDSPHPENAHLWLNYMLEPEVAAALSNYTFYASPNQAARKLVKPELLAEKHLYPPDDVLVHCEEIGDIGSVIAIYDRLWTELKCV
jgi:spermidine/putrescine transport system substrate-binding protein